MTKEIPTPVCGLVRNDMKIGMLSAVRRGFPHQERELVQNDTLIDLQSAVRAPPPHKCGGARTRAALKRVPFNNSKTVTALL